MRNLKRGIIIELMILISWIISVILLVDFDKVATYFWIEAAFVLLAYVIVVVTYLVVPNGKEGTQEINAILFIITFIYLLSQIITNSIAMLVFPDKKNKLVIIVDCLVIVVYITILMFAVQYAKRLNEQVESVSQKITPTVNYIAQIGIMLSATNDQEIKAELLKLKKSAEYGSNMSQKQTQEIEGAFLSQLTYIQQLINQNQRKEDIISAIQEANVIWMQRSSIISVDR